MIISKINYYQYTIPYKTPLYINKIKSKRREGIIIEICDTQKNSGLGEIAPLPGLHLETIEAITGRLHVIDNHLDRNTLPEQLDALQSTMEELFAKMHLFPSVEFAVSMALLDLSSKRLRIPLYKLFKKTCNAQVPVNGLLKGSPGEVEAQARELIAAGYTSLKLKVGLWPVEYDIELVKQLAQITGENIKLRLDANRKWTMPTALKFAQSLANCRLEYIEEPVNDPGDLLSFHEQTGLPVAIDESLPFFTAGNKKIPDWITAVILKPSLLGSIFKTIHYIGLAKKQNIKPVITSVYETSLSLKMLAQIAAAFLPTGTAVGLDTLKLLAGDTLHEPFSAADGFTDVTVDSMQNMTLKELYCRKM